ncbi:hypothetical protein SNE40_020419 [Patella caerulea]|uniref:Saposin B-type domain-containing protein n=1 Tax=Patella caerulea TaxID=87958 RepID=A0AAN8G2S4_PATCE
MYLKTYEIVFYLSFIEIVSAVMNGQLNLPDNLSKELYCAGCEETVKALDKMLSPRNGDTYDVRVLEALSMICDKNTFKSSEYSPHYMSIACSHLLEEHDDVLDPFLVSHYSRINRNNFSELLHQVCKGLSSACIKVNRNKMEKLKKQDVHINEDGSVDLNKGNWKRPNPAQEARDEF